MSAHGERAGAGRGGLSPLDVGVLRSLPRAGAMARWPTAQELATRVGVAADVAHSSLARLAGRGLVEHDGERPRSWARTRAGERLLAAGGGGRADRGAAEA